jgi:nucleotide-binding universal stress UspA family protein
MLSTILVPFDGSKLAERAFPYATALARAGGARLILWHARTGVTEDDLPIADLQATAGRLRDGGLKVEPDVYDADRGEVGRAICQAALEWQAKLIVMATHGRGGLGRFLYGSVADEVLRQATVPVLLVSSQSEHAWSIDRPPRILVPLDGSPLAEAALDPAGELAEALGAELLLLQVIEPLPPRAKTVAPELAGSHVTDELAKGRSYLEGIAQRVRRAGHRAVTHFAVGWPAAAIAEAASAERCDLIAMATHGRGGLARAAHGSVATGVLQRTGVPLLLTRPADLPTAGAGRLVPSEEHRDPAVVNQIERPDRPSMA